ncbi:MAG: RNA 2',3'-cyclic phosphodiesterase [Acidobacteriota bacterium]
METIRTFICIDLPETLKTRLQTFIQELQGQQRSTTVSWVKPQNLHLTLRFLGDVMVTRQLDLQACVERAAAIFKPFTLVAGGTGVFPNTRNARILWIGVKGADKQLIPLQKRLEQELRAAGFGKEDKPFSPHFTIGRVRQGNARTLAEAFSQASFADESFSVSEIIVMRSDLKPTGPIYSKMALIKLPN